MNDWRILNTFIYPHDAHMAKGYLESNGIEVVLKDELTVQVYNFYSNAIGGVKLLIREPEYDRGLEVLKQGGFVVPKDEQKKTNIEPIVLTGKTDVSACPYCKSHNIGRKKEPNILTLVLILFWLILPIYKRSYVCYDCSKKWKFTKEKHI